MPSNPARLSGSSKTPAPGLSGSRYHRAAPQRRTATVKVLGVEVPPAKAEREPVLQVPAIDMTQQAAVGETTASVDDVATADVPQPARRSRMAQRKPGRAKQAASKAAAPKRTRDGSVGRETFAAVEALVKDGTSKTDAFKAVAEKTGRSAGTVAANYYRVARSQGAANPRRRRGKATTVPSTSTRSEGRRRARSQPRTASPRGRTPGQASDLDRLANDLVQSVNNLAAAMRGQSQEVADLRRRLDGVRSLLD